MKKIVNIIILIVLLLTLSGCKLANEQKQKYREPQLIGYYFTYEHVSSTDSLEKRKATKIDDEFVFGYDGIAMFTYINTLSCDEENCPTYYIDQIDNAIIDYVYLQQEKEYLKTDDYTVFIEGSVYVDNTKSPFQLYANWVYQDSDGNLSISPVTSSSIRNGKELTDILVGSSMEVYDPLIHQLAISKNETTEIKTYYEFYTCYRIPLDYYLVHQIDSDQQFISTTKLEPNQYPDSFVKEMDTEYIILESYNTAENGETIIEREIIDKNNQEMTCIQLRNTGVYEAIRIKIK